MREIPEKRQIYISGRLWHEVYPKVDLTPFIYVLHDKIDIKKYGKGLKKFYFTFIVVKPHDEINVPYACFDKKEKAADIAVGISYSLVEHASQKETIKLMENAYLEGIEKLGELPIKDFDAAALKKDVESIFSRDGWYEMAVASDC